MLLALCGGACSENNDPYIPPKDDPTDDIVDEEVGKDTPVPHDMYLDNGQLINSYVDANRLDVSLSNNGKDIADLLYR